MPREWGEGDEERVARPVGFYPRGIEESARAASGVK